jgi:hypothetical protein
MLEELSNSSADDAEIEVPMKSNDSKYKPIDLKEDQRLVVEKNYFLGRCK